jgi:hypothetical protein
MTARHLVHPAVAAIFMCVFGSGCGTDSDGDNGDDTSAGGSLGSGGSGANASGGTSTTTGGASTGGASTGGAVSSTGGQATTGGTGGATTGGTGGETTTGGTGGEATGGTGGTFTGTCTASQSANRNPSGSGSHDVVVETNSDPGIEEGTIFRPADLGPGKKYPIFVWGQGGCSRDGLSTEAAMAEIASHGYFVVADGTPGGKEPNRELGGGGEVLLSYVDWVISENSKPCSAYYQSIDTTKVGANGFSCGGLMAAGTAADPRMTTWGHTSSGSFSVNQAFYDSIHTPVLIITGTADSLGANENGQRDFDNISARDDIPVMMFAKVGAGHGGDLWAQNGGHFTRINLAWLNWWLKGDMSATGKGMLVGGSCPYCTDNSWQIQSANLP